MRERERDFRALLQIDRDDLDTEVAQQPTLYNEVARAYATAISIRDELAKEIKVVRAEVGLDVRRRQEKKGGDTREKALDALVETDVRVKEINERSRVAALRAGILEADKESFKQRGFAIKMLCDMDNDMREARNDVRGPARQERLQDSYDSRRKEATMRRKRERI